MYITVGWVFDARMSPARVNDREIYGQSDIILNNSRDSEIYAQSDAILLTLHCSRDSETYGQRDAIFHCSRTSCSARGSYGGRKSTSILWVQFVCELVMFAQVM